MSIVIVVSSPPDRQAFRSFDTRSAVVSAEKILWPLLEAGRRVNVLVQATDLKVQRELEHYFSELVRTEIEFYARAGTKPIAPRGAKA